MSTTIFITEESPYNFTHLRVYSSSSLLNAEWSEVPFLRPIRLSEVAGPDIDEASFEVQVGYFSHRTDDGFDSPVAAVGIVEPYVVNRQYVKIQFLDDNGEEIRIWVGRLAYEEQEVAIRRVDTGSGEVDVKTGVQRLTAFGLLWEWENTTIGSSFVRDRDTDGTIDPERGIPFNFVDRAGGYVLRGNKDTLSSGAHVFSWESYSEARWTATTAIDYLCRFFLPETPAGNVAIGIDYTGVDLSWYDISVETDRKSVKAVLDELVDRRRLAGYYLKPYELGSSVFCSLIMFTFTDEFIDVGDDTIPANLNQVELVVRQDAIMANAVLRSVTTHVADRVIVEGAWITSTISVTFGEGAVEEGWTPTKETAFLDAAGGTDVDENTASRSRDELKDVFQRFVVPSDWDQLLDGDYAVTAQPENFPDVLDDGDIPGLFNDPEIMNPWRHVASRFLDYIAIKDNETDEFLRPFVVFPESQLDGNKWVFADQASVMERQFACHLHMLHDRLGFTLTVNRSAGASLLADNHFDEAADTPGDLDPESVEESFDYEDLIFTGTFEWDDRASAQVIINSTGDGTDRVRRIRVEDARLDIIIPGTITDIDDQGGLLTSAGEVLRDDRSRLQTIAAAAALWYGVPRRAITLTYHSLRPFVDIGQLMTAFVDNDLVEEVNTPITGIATDFVKGTTTIETAYAEADFASNRAGV